MNYRHAFHAGNFADLAKHATLLAVLRVFRPRQVLDTHAGAGLYDMRGEDARRTGEGEAGVLRLMDEGHPPGALAALRTAVAAANPQGGLRWYPGSPKLAVEALAPGSAYVGFELRPETHAALSHALRPPTGVRAEAVRADGYVATARRLGRKSDGATLVLVDPPFERPDDYGRALELISCATRAPGVGVLAWLPLKDLETFDAFLSRLEAQRPASLCVAQVRLRPLDNPMRMNGCALALVNLPDVDAEALAVCDWVARACGGPSARAHMERLPG